MHRLAALDQEASARLAIPREARLLRLLALATAHSGDSLFWLAGTAVAFTWGNTVWWAFGGRVLLGTVTAGAAVTALKWIFRRQRPPGERRRLYARFDHHAFPSGHAGRSACMVILLAPLLPAWGVVLLTLWAGLVGLARVALRVHFVSDILGGWAAGLLAGATLGLIL